jgi:hypothetical protein
MTVGEFCRRETQANELCVIRERGWIVASAWIDNEDLFAIHPDIKDREFISDEWGTLSIVDQHGKEIDIPCHYIDC